MKRNTLVIVSLLCSLFFVYSCSKELSLETGGKTGTANYTLWDSAGACIYDSVYGTYYNGIQPRGDTAFVEVQVNVTETGTYFISSDAQNGLTFADSGFFATTGINTIRLKPTGIPLEIRPAVFTLAVDSAICNFIVYVQDSTGTGLGGGGDTTGTGGSDTTNLSDTAWQFNAGTSYHHGSFDTVFVIDTLGLKYLTFVGSTAPRQDTAFLMGILLTSGSIQPGTYTTAFEAGFYLTTYTGTTPVPVYQADGTTSTSGVVTITITSYNSSTGIISGTVSGDAVDETGAVVPITDGSFTAKIT
ncbi:hypothetical protein I5907_08080 [Panacibacter sp. DH6]|uniref:Uncharacterized protein n=1 Tax=Panacibacter microcysteis TaxID=2793269 RepID=A0A931E6R4_9BACT|nr:hypothetical protein [Panacibacter microcysteis]MBG9376189.1 hypothetical protein [Panacibacter microcysteis]